MTNSEPSSGTTPPWSSSNDSAGMNCDHDVVTTYLRGPEKTPTAIRDALDPAQRKQFETEYRAALARAAETLDLEPVLTLVQRTWWVRAVMNLNPHMLDGVTADLRRVVAGDKSIIATQD